MVKKSKKLLSVLLSVLMAVSCFALPFSISAAGAYDDSVASSAKAALDAYEGAMNGTVYKSGMKTAYDAYVALNKAYDEYVYGANYEKDLASATTALTNATSAMSSSGTWSAYTGTAVPAFEKGTVTSTDAYANLLYSNMVNGGQSAFTYEVTDAWSNRRDRHQIGYNATVMMYDGSTTAKMPVMYFSQFIREDSFWSGKKSTTYSVFPISGSSGSTDHPNLTLVGLWYNNDKNADWNFDTNWGSKNSYQTGNNSSTVHAGPTFDPNNNSWGNWCGYANVLQLSNFDTNQWTASYNNLSWGIYVEAPGKTSVSDMQPVRNGRVNNAATIQVFNYQKVTDAIGSATNTLKNKNVANYKNGSLSTVMGYLDKLTVDPNSFFTSGNGIDNCVANYQTPADNMASAISSAATDKDYQSLREAIVAARTALSGDLSNYATDSVTSYQNYLAAAQNKFVDVDYTVPCTDELNALRGAKLLEKATDIDVFNKVREIITSSTFDSSVYTTEAQQKINEVLSNMNACLDSNGKATVSQNYINNLITEALTYINVKAEDANTNTNTNLQNQKFTLTVYSTVDGTTATNSKSYAFGKVANINDVFDLQGYLNDSHTVSCVVSTPNSTNAKDVVIDLTMFDKTFFMQQDITVTLDIKTKGEGVVIIQGYDGSVITSYTGTAVLSEDGKTLTVNGETVSPIESPTYTFTKWVKVSTADGTVVYKQVGSRISQANKITVVDGSISNTPESLNAGYTINYTGSDTFLAWVKIVGDVTVVDSYQATDLVRYTSTEGSVTYIAITEQNIDSSTLGPNNDIKLSDDIKQTIQLKAPATYSTGYVANDKFVISGEFTNTGIDTSKYTITSVGVVISKTNTEPTKGGSACAALEIKNYSSSGTFTASINSSVSTLYGRTYVAYTENVDGVGEVTRIAYGPVCTINK